MKTFIKKEFLEQIRSHRLLILIAVFFLLGILNPFTALITPWLLESLSETLEGSGIIVEDTIITALDSWMQFFKNLPIALIVFILMQSSIFTKEYQNKTLSLVLTKGFERHKIVISKFIVLTILWSLCYWLCFIITYSYNAYYWDNSIANNLLVATLNWYILGLFVVSLFTFFSVLSNTNSGALAFMCIVLFGLYLFGLLLKISKYLPMELSDGNSLIYGLEEVNNYIPSLVITICIAIALLISSILIFKKKKL